MYTLQYDGRTRLSSEIGSTTIGTGTGTLATQLGKITGSIVLAAGTIHTWTITNPNVTSNSFINAWIYQGAGTATSGYVVEGGTSLAGSFTINVTNPSAVAGSIVPIVEYYIFKY